MTTQSQGWHHGRLIATIFFGSVPKRWQDDLVFSSSFLWHFDNFRQPFVSLKNINWNRAVQNKNRFFTSNLFTSNYVFTSVKPLEHLTAMQFWLTKLMLRKECKALLWVKCWALGLRHYLRLMHSYGTGANRSNCAILQILLVLFHRRANLQQDCGKTVTKPWDSLVLGINSTTLIQVNQSRFLLHLFASGRECQQR